MPDILEATYFILDHDFMYNYLKKINCGYPTD